MPPKVPRRTKVTHSRQRLSVVNERSILAYKDLTKAAAQGLTTKLTRGTLKKKLHIPTDNEGTKLQESMMAMAERGGATPEQYAKLANMDPEKLAQFYAANDLAFEVYFNYEGISKNGMSYSASDKKRQDFDWFIDQYEKAYGTVPVQRQTVF